MSEVKALTVLRDNFGDEIELFEDEDGEAYTLLAELEVRGKRYAFFQNEELKQEDEIYILQYTQDEQGQFELSTIDDDDEWEDIAEIYDEFTHSESLE